MSGPAYINVGNPLPLLYAVVALVEELPDWRVHNRTSQGEENGLAVLYLGDDLPLREFGFVLHVFSDRPSEIQLTCYASRWGEDRNFPSEEEYRAGEAKAWAVVRQAGRQLGLRLRLRHPTVRPHPLRGCLREELQRFTVVATNDWTGERMRRLDPRDESAFHDFIRTAHQYNSVLTPDDVRHHLREAGFADELVTELVHQYEIGRRILGRCIYPWEERRRRKDALNRRQEADARELAEYLARREQGEDRTRTPVTQG